MKKLYLLIITIFFCSFIVQAQTIRLEAEDAELSGGGGSPPLIQEDPECSGGKYVQTREGNLKFSFNVETGGNYKVIARACARYGNKQITFTFDGSNTTNASFPENTAYDDITVAESYFFSAGAHIIDLIKNWGWIDLDYLELSISEEPPIEFNIDPLVTPNPHKAASMLYDFLKTNFEKKIVSGVMTLKSLSTISGSNQNEISWLNDKTGMKPALLGMDFMDHTGNIPSSWINNPDLIQDAITWKNSNGIVALCWHWRDPSHKTTAFYTAETDFDATKIFDTGSTDYTAMIRDMDIVAGYLKELQNENIPILWRPLHEASGTWFWWGAKGAEACKEIWRVMFDRFTNHHGLKNLIWVWTSEANAAALDWYPGDEYVDIIGLDDYSDTNHGSRMLAFQELKNVFQGKKMLALSEVGSVPDFTNMQRDQAIWSYYMPWYGEHTKTDNWNTVDFWTNSLSDPNVINLADMPADFYNSIPQVKYNQFKVYGGSMRVYIETNTSGQYNVHICDLSGRRILTEQGLSASQYINVSHLTSGIYIITIEQNNKKESSKLKIN